MPQLNCTTVVARKRKPAVNTPATDARAERHQAQADVLRQTKMPSFSVSSGRRIIDHDGRFVEARAKLFAERKSFPFGQVGDFGEHAGANIENSRDGKPHSPQTGCHVACRGDLLKRRVGVSAKVLTCGLK